jgi:hypothetical protein
VPPVGIASGPGWCTSPTSTIVTTWRICRTDPNGKTLQARGESLPFGSPRGLCRAQTSPQTGGRFDLQANRPNAPLRSRDPKRAAAGRPVPFLGGQAVRDPRCPITSYLAELKTIDSARVGELQESYFPGVIDWDYPSLRLDPSKIDTRAKLWFFINCSIQIDAARFAFTERVAKERVLPHLPASAGECLLIEGSAGKRFERLDVQRSRDDLCTAANLTLHEVYRALVRLGFSMVVPLPVWPKLSRVEAVAEVLRAGTLMVELERNNAAGPTLTGDPAPALEGTAATVRKRSKPGDARLKLDAALDSLIAKKEWGKTQKKIAHAARISRSQFYELTNAKTGDAEILRKLKEYQRESRGRGPARVADL